MSNTFRKILCAGLAAALTLSMTVTAYADEPYTSYNYDTWGDPLPSQNSYKIARSVNGKYMGLGRLSDKNDKLFVSEKAPDTLKNAQDFFFENESKEFWVCDTDNNRILRLDSELNLIGCYTGVKGDTEINTGKDGESAFKKPQGIFVGKPNTADETYVYIADTENERVVKASIKDERELDLVIEYTKPESELYESSSFTPSKVLADGSENVYAICKTENKGSVQFDKNGEFQGFYGANRVEVTAAVIAQKIRRKFASKEKIANMERTVPTEYANFDIDDEGFIYTVTEAGDTKTDAVKKLNAAGYNIWDNEEHDEIVYGDMPLKTKTQKAVTSTKLTDMVVTDNGIMNILDFGTGHIFQYDRDSRLLCIFGIKKDVENASARGSFAAPTAIEAYGSNIYVLDGTKNDITVFSETTFGKALHNAEELYAQGKYLEAKPYWEEVLARDGGYVRAYAGLGKAALKEGEYTKAMDYFKTANYKDSYDKAFKYARDEFIKSHFKLIGFIILVLIALLVTKNQLNKRGKTLIPRKKKPQEEG